MPFYPPGFGFREGRGFAIIEPSGTFNAATQAAGETARNTYASNNADWLARLDANPSLLVRLTWPTTPTNAAFYGRANSSWVNLTALLAQAGPAGPAGPNGRQGIWWAQVWQAAASVPASAPTTYSIAASGAITNLDNDWLNAPPATVADGEAVYTALTLVNPASVTFPVTSGLTWSAVMRLTGPAGPTGPAGSGGGGGFDYDSLVRLSAPALGDDLAAWDTSAAVWKKLSLTALRTLVQRTAAQLRTAIGTATSSVAGLMSAADKTKLDGSDEGAEVNPDNVSLAFRTENGSSAVPGQIFFIKADNTEWQSGSSNDISAIEIDADQYTLTQNPDTDTATYRGWHNLPENIVEHRGSTIWTFQRIADESPFTPIGGTLRIQAENIVKNDDGNFVLQNLVVLEGLSQTFGSGVNWQVVGVFAPPSGADAIIGVIVKDKLPGDVVYEGELAGHEDDLYTSYNDAGSGFWPGAMAFYNQSSGAPDVANIVGQPSVADGTVTWAFGRFRTDRDPDNLVYADEKAAADFASGQVYYISAWNTPGTYATLTLTSGGTLVGTGNGRYIYGTGTLANAANIQDVADIGDYLLVAEQVPSRLQIEIPASDVDGLLAYIVERVKARNASDPISGASKLLLADLTGLTIDHLERHFADRYQSFGNYSIVVSGQYDAKGEIDASQLTNANKQIRIAVTDDTLADFISELTQGKLVELYVDDSNYLLGRVQANTADSLRAAINGRYLRLSTLEIVGSVGAGDTAELRHYIQGDGLVPVPTGSDIGKALIASAINVYGWHQIFPSWTKFTNLTANWSDVLTGVGNDEYVEARGVTVRDSMNLGPLLFSDIPTSAVWLSSNPDSAGASKSAATVRPCKRGFRAARRLTS